MKKHRSFIAVWALSVALSFAGWMRSLADLGIRTYRRAKDWAVDVVRSVASLPVANRLPMARLSAAAAFVLRMAKRERPVIQARWRMCPSG